MRGERNISLDPNVKDKNELISLASQLFLNLNYTGKVKVFDPESNVYKEEFLKRRLYKLLEIILLLYTRNIWRRMKSLEVIIADYMEESIC